VLILRIRIIRYRCYLPCSLYQTCLVCDSGCVELNQSSRQKGTAKGKGKGVAGTVRDAVRLQKEALRKNSCQPTAGMSSVPLTNSPDNGESSEDNDGGGQQGIGERQGSVVRGKKRAGNEASEAVDSMKRKTPAKGNSESDSSESPPQ